MTDVTIDGAKQETATVQAGRPGVFAALIWVVVFLGLQLVVTLIAMLAFGNFDYTSPDVGQQMAAFPMTPAGAQIVITSLIPSGLLLLGGMWLAYGSNWEHAADTGMPKLRAIGLAVLLLGCAYLFNFLYSTYVIPGIDAQKEIVQMLAAIPKTPVNIAIMFMAVAIFAGIVEEVVFRWGLQGALIKKIRDRQNSLKQKSEKTEKAEERESLNRKVALIGKIGPWLAIGMAAMVFALIHFQPYAIPSLFVMGAVFGYIYHITGSLRLTIMLHLVNNAFAVTMLLLGIEAAA